MMLKLEEIQKLNKTELHAHLGSMVTPDKLWEMAMVMGQKIPANNLPDFRDIIVGNGEPRQIGHQAYLNKYFLTQRIQSSPKAIELSVYNSIVNAYVTDNVTDIEIRFNPMLRNQDGFYNLDAIIGSACIGVIRAMSIYPVNAGLIISTDRSFTPEQHLTLAKKTIKYAGKGVVGFDVSGASPSDFKISDLLESYTLVRKSGIKTTIHTGEVPSVDISEMEWVIENLQPNRIGHGIRSHKNQRILDMLVESKIHLEVCPVSNVKTGCVSSMSEIAKITHKFLEKGVSVSLNTDGVVFLNTTLSEQFLSVCDSIDQVKVLLNNAKENSFLATIIN